MMLYWKHRPDYTIPYRVMKSVGFISLANAQNSVCKSMRIGDTIYLDHQSTTPTDRRVLDAMVPYFNEQFANPHSAEHSLGWEAAKAVEKASSQVAALLGADGSEVIFTSGATEANNLALLGLAIGAKGGPRNRILVSAIEHSSVLEPACILRDQYGFDLEVLPVDGHGTVNLSLLGDVLDERVLLVSIMPVNNEIGTIQPIKEIYELCSSYGALLHCDGAQAPTAIDISDVAEYVDLLSLSAHKMYGPKGLGALFVHQSVSDRLRPIIHGGGQQGRLRSGTVPTPLCVGMGTAAEIIMADSAEQDRQKLSALRNRFVAGLQALDWPIWLNGPPLAERHPGNANVCFEGFSADSILAALQPKLAASSGSACTTGIPEPSHVLSAIGLSDVEEAGSIRFSLGRYTTEQDMQDAAGLIEEVLARLQDSGTA